MGKPVSPPSEARTTFAITPLDAQKVEGDDGLTAYTFTLTRSGDTKKAGSVSYTTAGAQAEDFGGALTGTVNFAPGETTKTITVWVVGDSLVEADESFTVSLTNAVGGSITGASASGTIQNDDVPPPPPPPPPDPKLDISSEAGWYDADEDGFADAGESVWHTYSISNIGDVPLSAVELHDVAVGGAVSGPAAGDVDGDGLLDVGETWVFHSKYDLTQAEVDSGVVHSDATASAVAPAGQVVSDSFQLDTPLPQNAELFLYTNGWWMDGSGSGTENLVADVGELVRFTFGIHNMGTVTLSNITLSDPMLDASAIMYLEGDNNSDGLLDMGESWIYVGEYALTQADLDARTLTDLATATGMAPGLEIVSDWARCDVSLPWM